MTCPYHDASPASKPESIVHDEKAQLDFSRDMSYGDYLQLDAILNAQKPLSPAHDELLFIVQHQTSELWMKLMLHELTAAIRNIADDQLNPAFKQMARVSKIMEQLVHAWDVLATMTPPEYSAIRPYLSNSSGFQSWQYRCIEFMLGNKNPAMLKPHAHRPDLLAKVEAAWRAPSLYDESLRLLARRGLPVPTPYIERDWTQPYEAHPGVEAATVNLATERAHVVYDPSTAPGMDAVLRRAVRNASVSSMPARWAISASQLMATRTHSAWCSTWPAMRC